ncbi:MAG TPA: sugar-binding transcriptional regulator [Firmicutes bacterium]|nr:sugar-binding transcriptional regulator [Bacillota bacterium]
MDRRRLAQIAYLYYKEKLSQDEIAQCVGLSRSQISRLLAEAENVGVVRIEIDEVDDRAHDLEEGLKQAFGLEDAMVVYRMGTQDASVRKTIGRAAARYLAETLIDGDSIGITSGHTLREVVRFLRRPEARDLKVVQLMGGAGATALQTYPEELARDYAQALGATLFSLHAPLVVEDKGVRDIIMSTASVTEVTRMWDTLSVVVMGVGDLSVDALLFKAGWFTPDDLNLLVSAGAVGVICGQFFDLRGKRVNSPADERIIAAPLESFRHARRSIAVAGGSTKAVPLLAAIRGGYCNTVITDDKTAQEMLARVESVEARTATR